MTKSELRHDFESELWIFGHSDFLRHSGFGVRHSKLPPLRETVRSTKLADAANS